MIFYHGGAAAIEKIDAGRVSSDGELLCASASVNVALRYGPVVSKFELLASNVKTVSVIEWMSGASPANEDLRLSGYEAMVVSGNDGFDFPKDTLFILAPAAVRYLGTASEAELLAKDDGLAKSHAPRPSEPGFSTYAKDLFESIGDAIPDWVATPGGGFSITIDADEQDSEWVGIAEPSGAGWVSKCPTRSLEANLPTMELALSQVDSWQMEEESRRLEARKSLSHQRKYRP